VYYQPVAKEMAAIKRFFEKRKLDVKFKRAGEGHKLDEESGSTSPKHTQTAHVQPPPRGSDLTHQQRMAADAAVARMNQPKAGNKLLLIICPLLLFLLFLFLLHNFIS